MTFVNDTRNSSTVTNNSRNTSSFLNWLRHGTAPRMDIDVVSAELSELAPFTFESVVFEDGTVLKNVTFAELVEQVWTNQSRN